MKYTKQISKKKKSKVIRKNPAFIIPAIPFIVEGIGVAWGAAVSAAPYIVAAFATGAGVGLIERKLNADRTIVDSISKTIPPTISLPQPLDWLTRSKRKAKPKTQTIPKTTYPISPIPTPPQKPDMDWLKKFVEWFQVSVQRNGLQTLKDTIQFIKNSPKHILDFVTKTIGRLDAWEQANPWKKRLFIFVWIIYLSPKIDKLVDYIQGSVEPFYKDTSLVNLSRTLDQNIDAYPFLKNVDVVTHSDLVMLNMRASLLATYPNVLERTIYRYQLKSTQELQADAEDSLVNIKKYHRDVVGEHNTLFVPQEISKEYFDAMQFIPADPFSFKVLQGLKSNCDIQELYVEGNRSKPKPYLDRQDKIWRSMKDAFGSPADGYAFTQLKHNIFNDQNRFLLSLAMSVTVSKARKYWRDRYDLACTAPSVRGLAPSKNCFNNLPNIFDIADRNVPYLEENWTWANFSLLENLVPKGQDSYLPTALKPAYYYDVLQYIQNRRTSRTVQNMQETPQGRNKLQNVELLYTQTILPIKKDISPLEAQRIMSNLIWVLINDARKLENTPVDEPYFLKNFQAMYKPNPKTKTVGRVYSREPDILLQSAIENYLFEILGFQSAGEDTVTSARMYGYFRFSLGLIQLTSAFEQGLSNADFIAGLKSLFNYLKDLSSEVVLEVIENYAIVYVSQLMENSVTALKSETMVVVFMWVLDLILPDFVKQYFIDWIYFNKEQTQILEDFYKNFVDLFVDYAPFTADEVSDQNNIIYDRVFIPNMDKIDQKDYLDFCYQISQADSSKILSGVIFFENKKV